GIEGELKGLVLLFTHWVQASGVSFAPQNRMNTGVGPIIRWFTPTSKGKCGLIRDALAVRPTSTPRRPASGSVLSLAILCRHVALRDPGKPIGCLYPVPSPTALAFDLLGRCRHFPHPPPSDSRGGVHFGD